MQSIQMGIMLLFMGLSPIIIFLILVLIGHFRGGI